MKKEKIQKVEKYEKLHNKLKDFPGQLPPSFIHVW
jgi:hypothetical protein